MTRRMMFILIAFFICLLSETFAFSAEIPSSETDVLISKVMTEILTTKTGCEITERFFMLNIQRMQAFFGINAEAAKKIAQTCPGDNKPALSFFYYIPDSKRPAKTYHLHIEPSNNFFMGWTNTNNETHIIMKEFNENILRQILAHELIVTMDDKFRISYQDFKLFNFTTIFPASSQCKINRFLANPFYQAVLTGLRAYRMELLFAQNLNDNAWLKTLAQMKAIQTDPRLSFKNMTEALWPARFSLISFYQNYIDPCHDQKFNILSLNKEEIEQFIYRDFKELQNELSEYQLFELLKFLAFEVVISSTDSNIVNFGPRPNIGSGGWSLKNNSLEQIKEMIPQRELGVKDNQFELARARGERFQELNAGKSKIESVPMLIPTRKESVISK
ncbi:MAG: hypothetical protein ACXWRZ_11895 [Bdellovibrio sp.]